jgi:ATP-dependent Lon protease
VVEALKMPGQGRVMTTGQLGEVMKESIQAAHSYVRSRADMLEIDAEAFSNYDIHIHFPRRRAEGRSFGRRHDRPGDRLGAQRSADPSTTSR